MKRRDFLMATGGGMVGAIVGGSSGRSAEAAPEATRICVRRGHDIVPVGDEGSGVWMRGRRVLECQRCHVLLLDPEITRP